MSKMQNRRKRRKLSKLLTSLPEIKTRRSSIFTNKTHSTRKDYDRSLSKRILKEELST